MSERENVEEKLPVFQLTAHWGLVLDTCGWVSVITLETTTLDYLP